ncbi:MAG: phospholipase C, phosphocholine-specific [Ginsengibacter sp.]
MDTRRDFLKKAMLLSGATGVANIIPMSIQKALAINPQTGSTYIDAEYVVILMQENRSFDHCFGTLRGVRGFNDPRAINLPDKNLVWLQTNKAGETYTPFRFDIRDTKITWMGSVPHSRASQVDAHNRGKNDKWLDSKRSDNKKYADMPLTLGHYTRNDLPFNYALADAFTICDQHFCSAMTSTWPNRLYLWSGTIRGEKTANAKAYIKNEIPYGEAHWKTFPERLEENDVSWRVYQNDISTGGGFKDEERAWLANYKCNQLEFLSQFNVKFSSRYITGLQKLSKSLPDVIAGLETKIASMSSKYKDFEKLQKEIVKKKEVLKNAEEELIKWSSDNFDKLSQEQKNIYQKAFTTNKDDPDYHKLSTLHFEENGVKRELLIPKGDLFYQFRKDVDSGQLPTVSWLVPSQNFSDHPSAPWYGAWYTSEVLDILTKNPEVWKKTIFILTYDENDGYFDHVPPFVAPDPEDPQTGKCSKGVNVSGVEFIRREQEIKEGIPEKDARSGPIGLGFRVPMIIASPWSRGGNVCSQVFDHTSVLQFLEEFLNKKFNKEIKQTNISEWRRTVCGNLTSVFKLYTGQHSEKLPFLPRDPLIEKIYNAQFKNEPSDFRKLSALEIKQINRDPSSSPWMPQQEKGVRPSCPLPYQLYAHGKLSPDKKKFELTMKAGNEVFGKDSAGSPFNVYGLGLYLSMDDEAAKRKTYESVRAWHYAVTAGDALTDLWPLTSFVNENYHLRVYGPNGFFREFTGNNQDPSLLIECNYQQNRLFKNKLTGNLELKIKNTSNNDSYQLEVEDRSYGNKAIHKTISPSEEETILLDSRRGFGWYDFRVCIKDDTAFSQRFAGRVETGKESFSDPVMGKVKI